METVAGTPVLLDISVENRSGTTLLYANTPHLESGHWTIVVKNKNGDDVPRTIWGERQASEAFDSIQIRSLMEGRVVVEQIPVSRLFDLSVAGTYAVQVCFSGRVQLAGKPQPVELATSTTLKITHH